MIENSRVRTDLPEYITFKHSFCLRWGSIVTIIKYLEDFCRTYGIEVGHMDGLKLKRFSYFFVSFCKLFKFFLLKIKRVSELSRCIDMDLKPSQEELMETFTNKDEIEKIVKTPV